MTTGYADNPIFRGRRSAGVHYLFHNVLSSQGIFQTSARKERMISFRSYPRSNSPYALRLLRLIVNKSRAGGFEDTLP